MKYCPNCGKELIVDSKFCYECGTNLTQILQPTLPPLEPKVTEEENNEVIFIEQEVIPAMPTIGKESFMDTKRENLTGLLFSTIYLLGAILTMVVWRGYGNEVGELYCMTTSSIFLILFIVLIIFYIIKKIGSHIVIGMMIIALSIFIGFMWAYYGYKNAYFDTGYFLFIWPVILFMGFIFLIYSLFEPSKEK